MVLFPLWCSMWAQTSVRVSTMLITTRCLPFKLTYGFNLCLYFDNRIPGLLTAKLYNNNFIIIIHNVRMEEGTVWNKAENDFTLHATQRSTAAVV